MNKELDRIVANSPDGLKNNPIFKELVNEITKNKEKESQKWFSFLLLISYVIYYIIVITLIERQNN